jgi:hypothetical protein
LVSGLGGPNRSQTVSNRLRILIINLSKMAILNSFKWF